MGTTRTAVVTGGGRGIGRAICARLAAGGASVAVLDIDPEGANRAARELCSTGATALGVVADVADKTSVHSALDRIHAELGPVEILVNNAAVSTLVPFLDLTEELWDRTIAVHLRGTFLCCQAMIPDMVRAGWGRIINLASVAALTGGGPTIGHYAAAKGGIISLTRALALEFAANGITVNVVAPGLVDTPGLRASGMPHKAIEALGKQSPAGRLGTPEDIAAACAYLVSEEASFFTGQIMSPNGGVYM